MAAKAVRGGKQGAEKCIKTYNAEAILSAQEQGVLQVRKQHSRPPTLAKDVGTAGLSSSC